MKNLLKKEITAKFHVEVIYSDSSQFDFEVEMNDTESRIYGGICMITRGTLMATSAVTATAYKEDGFEICSYRK